MEDAIGDKINVITIFNWEKQTVIPYKITWQKREYFIKKLNYYFKQRENGIIIHNFYVNDGQLDFYLKFNSDSLNWTLQHIYDGSSN